MALGGRGGGLDGKGSHPITGRKPIRMRAEGVCGFKAGRKGQHNTTLNNLPSLPPIHTKREVGKQPTCS